MAYYNRKPQLYRTLRTIECSVLPRDDFEVIIVDDASNEEHRLTLEFTQQFDINIQLLTVKPEEKTWINPCIPYNMAFRAATGEKIIIQNPEVIHLGDILSSVNQALGLNEYRVHCILALSKDDTALLGNIVDLQELKNIIDPISAKTFHIGSGPTLWYIHPQYRKKYYHFLTALHHKDLLELGGFDERYQHDSAYDDNEFITRIMRKQMDIKIVDSPIGVHQFHENFDFKNKGPEFRQKNRNLLLNYTRKETTICPQPL